MVDVAIVGAGPAGSALAILLAQAGLSVDLYDHAKFPRPKPCGEGIMPHGSPVLKKLGVALDAKPILGLTYHNRRGANVSCDFETPGLAVPRTILDETLVRRAAELVNFREGVEVKSLNLGAKLIVGADGSHSSVRTLAGIGMKRPARRRFGMSGHWRAEGDDHVHVWLIGSGEIYTVCEHGGMLVSLLLEQEAMGPLPEHYEQIVRKRLGYAERIGPVLAAGPLGGWAEKVYRPGLLLIGDAAGSPDPMTGEGIALAFRCAEAVAEILVRDLTALPACAAAMRRLTRGPRALSEALLTLTADPERADRFVETLRDHPSLFKALLGAAAKGQAPPPLTGVLVAWV